MLLASLAAAVALATFAAPGANAFGTNCHKYTEADRKTAVFPNPNEMPPNFKVVFLGDAGTGVNQANVLRMAVEFDPTVIVHAGDFDYIDSPSTFLRNIDAVVPESIIYLATIGNHDEDAWDGSSGYQALLLDRLARSNATQYCDGDFGVSGACYIGGMYFVLSGVGTQGVGHVDYLQDAFSAVPAVWKVGVWHKNQHLYQTGDKSDETGYAILDAAREFGAIIHTGHEHSYSRTYLMNDFATQSYVNTVSSPLEISPGETFLFVSGLAGNSIRAWIDDAQENPWWAACAASDNGVKDGALYCTFNIGGNLRAASCYFMDTNGVIFDQFDIVNNNPDTIVQAKQPRCHVPFYDIAAANGDADAHENLKTGRVSLDSSVLALGGRDEAHGNMVALRFDNIPVPAGARIKTANLQLFGMSSSNRDVAPKIEIRAELNVAPAAFESTRRNLSKRAGTASSVAWTHDGDEFEPKAVWVSPNIKTVVDEVISLPNWRQGNSIVVTITGLSQLEVASFDRSQCLAPSLIIELETDC